MRQKFQKRGFWVTELRGKTLEPCNWAQILALPLTSEVTLTKLFPLLGSQPLHLFLSEIPPLFSPSSVPTISLLRSCFVLQRASFLEVGACQGSIEFPGLIGSWKGSVQAISLPPDWLFWMGPRILRNVLWE